jgi:hypothetical protein
MYFLSQHKLKTNMSGNTEQRAIVPSTDEIVTPEEMQDRVSRHVFELQCRLLTSAAWASMSPTHDLEAVS